MNFSSNDIIVYLTGYFWPFARIAALMSIAPIFSAKVATKRVKIGLALALTIVITPMLDPVSNIDPISADGILVTIYQIIIGLVMGFMVRMIFSTLETGGHIIGQTMGLGFAQMLDPANGITVPVVSQFYTIMATLMFLAINGHLILISVLAESFEILPVGLNMIGSNGLWILLSWSSWIFSGAVIIALPAVSALLLVNVAFGVMMKAAPQLNIFSIGFPITLMMGFVFIFISLPLFIPQFSNLVESSFLTINTIITGK